ncbi:hypothetical protein H8B02_05340 [Bradyrhizobium sp. Pear77]|uniref:hypothetical protein n=1 Tax=Bradyrhizobium altum TaxID=1571202 RepID=UPI001E5461BB|nr:hypothetical protein [Bradyrhizobium altum]MCC8952906.1 hypothetical protein [Bradyrhizobium altum]
MTGEIIQLHELYAFVLASQRSSTMRRRRLLRERDAVGTAGARFQPVQAKEGAMSGDDTGSVNAALLQMAAKIGGLQSTVATPLHTWQRMEEKASEGRKDLHQKVEALCAEVMTMGAQISTATKEIADMKPTVQAVRMGKRRQPACATSRN